MRAPILLPALVRAHGLLSVDVDSLSLMLGVGSSAAEGSPSGPAGVGSGLVVVARHHLVSCLKCWLEAAEPWQPELVPQVLLGGQAPGLELGVATAQVGGYMGGWRSGTGSAVLLRAPAECALALFDCLFVPPSIRVAGSAPPTSQPGCLITVVRSADSQRDVHLGLPPGRPVSPRVAVCWPAAGPGPPVWCALQAQPLCM